MRCMISVSPPWCPALRACVVASVASASAVAAVVIDAPKQSDHPGTVELPYVAC